MQDFVDVYIVGAGIFLINLTCWFFSGDNALLRSWLWESRGITRLLPKPHGEPVFFNKVRLGVIVGTHT